jgi:hypothetical protein
MQLLSNQSDMVEGHSQAIPQNIIIIARLNLPEIGMSIILVISPGVIPLLNQGSAIITQRQ